MNQTNQTRTSPLRNAIPVMKLRNQQSQQSLTGNRQVNQLPTVNRKIDRISVLAKAKTAIGHYNNYVTNFDEQKVEATKLNTLRQLPIEGINDSQQLSATSWFIEVQDHLELSFE
ncbi:Hypothetical_protein [Hexamita inflata]|uniref:Hypothetical_protein n=1 Tax=Hexamita inflata TaxID=28002 RepID=A0ABP1HDP5_9EUKA